MDGYPLRVTVLSTTSRFGGSVFLGLSVLGLRFPDLGGSDVLGLRSEFSRHLFKRDQPEIASALYGRDKTACYHAANTILAFKDISQRSGTCIQQLDQTSPIHKNERVPMTVIQWKTMYTSQWWCRYSWVISLCTYVRRWSFWSSSVFGEGKSCNKSNKKWSGISKLNNVEFSIYTLGGRRIRNIWVWNKWCVDTRGYAPITLLHSQHPCSIPHAPAVKANCANKISGKMAIKTETTQIHCLSSAHAAIPSDIASR